MRIILLTCLLLFSVNTTSRNGFNESIVLERVDIEEDVNIIDKSEIECLAANIYFESVGEPLEGQLAVANVTINRVNHYNFPDTICGVVKQKNKKACQFSWYCQRHKRNLFDNKKISDRYYIKVYKLAESFLIDYDKYHDNTNGSLFYHATRIKPAWSLSMSKATEIDNHVFYY